MADQMEVDLLDDYVLSVELSGHDNEIRALCLCTDGSILSAGQDNVVKRWVQTSSSSWVDSGQVSPHPDWVTTILPIPASIMAKCNNGGFITGSLDRPSIKAGKGAPIRIFNLEGAEVVALKGHTQGIVSLGWTVSFDLVSGSWDGTARVWSLAALSTLQDNISPDISTAACTHILRGHENAVVVLPLADGNIATGSSGSTVDPATGKSDCKLRVWSIGESGTSQVIKTFTEHSLNVRALTNAPALGGCFMTGANDGQVFLRSIDGSPLQQFKSTSLSSNSQKLCGILSIDCVSAEHATVSNESTSFFVTSSLDENVCVWRGGNCVQHIPHPGTPWKVIILPNGDLVTACGDKRVRIWTRNASHAASKELQNSFQESLVSRTTEGPKLNPSEYPSVADMEAGKVPNPKGNGGVQMFSKDNKLYACIWVLQGEVTGSSGGGNLGKKKTNDGKEWDEVIDLDLDGGLVLQLGFNWNDDPWHVASTFCQKHELSSNYEEQIGNYIAGQQAQRGITPSSHSQSDCNPIQTTSNTTSKYFPSNASHVYTSINIDGMLKKMISCNNSLKESDSNCFLNDENIQVLVDLSECLKDKSHYHSRLLPPKTSILLMKLLDWPSNILFPCIDLIRVVFTHPDAIDSDMKSMDEKRIRELVSKIIRRVGDSDASSVAQKLALKAFTNIIAGRGSRQKMMTISSCSVMNDITLFACNHAGTNDTKLRQITSSLLMNISTAFFEIDTDSTVFRPNLDRSTDLLLVARACVDGCAKIIGNSLCHSDKLSIKRALIATGTILSAVPFRQRYSAGAMVSLPSAVKSVMLTNIIDQWKETVASLQGTGKMDEAQYVVELIDICNTVVNISTSYERLK